MKMKEYQDVVVDIIFLSVDLIRTSGDEDETERLPFIGSPTEGIFG